MSRATKSLLGAALDIIDSLQVKLAMASKTDFARDIRVRDDLISDLASRLNAALQANKEANPQEVEDACQLGYEAGKAFGYLECKKEQASLIDAVREEARKEGDIAGYVRGHEECRKIFTDSGWSDATKAKEATDTAYANGHTAGYDRGYRRGYRMGYRLGKAQNGPAVL